MRNAKVFEKRADPVFRRLRAVALLRRFIPNYFFLKHFTFEMLA
jgi:hypothetical protein